MPDAAAPIAPTATPDAKKKKLFGVVAVAQGFCTEDQVIDCLEAQIKLEEMGLPQRIGEILLKKGFLTEEQVEKVTQELDTKAVLAGFELMEKVGQGGMGAVFRARQVSMDRIVALKLLPKQLAKDPKYKERFKREARLSAKLSHPNIVAAIDVGESRGYMYYAMEFVEGKTIRQLIREKGKLSLEEALNFITQVIEGLEYAHKQKLIHRDIKPDNIMINERGEAKLCDLGLARKTGMERGVGPSLCGRVIVAEIGIPRFLLAPQG